MCILLDGRGKNGLHHIVNVDRYVGIRGLYELVQLETFDDKGIDVERGCGDSKSSLRQGVS